MRHRRRRLMWKRVSRSTRTQYVFSCEHVPLRRKKHDYADLRSDNFIEKQLLFVAVSQHRSKHIHSNSEPMVDPCCRAQIPRDHKKNKKINIIWQPKSKLVIIIILKMLAVCAEEGNMPTTPCDCSRASMPSTIILRVRCVEALASSGPCWCSLSLVTELPVFPRNGWGEVQFPYGQKLKCSFWRATHQRRQPKRQRPWSQNGVHCTRRDRTLPFSTRNFTLGNLWISWNWYAFHYMLNVDSWNESILNQRACRRNSQRPGAGPSIGILP